MPMAANLSRRKLVLGGLLLATLMVSAWTLLSGSADSVVEPVARAGKVTAPGAKGTGATRKPAAPAMLDELVLVERPQAPARMVNLFPAYNYQAPAAAAPSAASMAKPHAPPLPFVYTGRLEIEGATTYLLMQGDVPLSVTAGAVVGEFTLVEAGGDRLVFEHGPTGERVVLPTAAAN
jgi:hypothetical protein